MGEREREREREERREKRERERVINITSVDQLNGREKEQLMREWFQVLFKISLSG